MNRAIAYVYLPLTISLLLRLSETLLGHCAMVVALWLQNKHWGGILSKGAFLFLSLNKRHLILNAEYIIKMTSHVTLPTAEILSGKNA